MAAAKSCREDSSSSLVGETRRLTGGAVLCAFTVHEDLRGSLCAGGFLDHVPFVPARFFTVYKVPGKDVRGENAHLACQQFLVGVAGSLSVLVDDGAAREEVVLDSPSAGLYIPPMVWSVQYRFSEDAVLLVFASHAYDAADYVRDYEQFLRLSAER